MTIQDKPERLEITSSSHFYMTSDLHFFHKRICDFTERKKYTNTEQHNQWLIQQLNKTIPVTTDTVKPITLHLGDMFFSCTNEEAINVLSQLNGDWWFIFGNHDSTGKLETVINTVNQMKGTNHRLLGWYYRLNIVEKSEVKDKKDFKKLVILCHFPIESWDSMGRGSWHCFGHCVDLETEILTESGWKFRKDLLKSDKIYSLNKETELLELQNIDQIIDVNYSGIVYETNKSLFNARFTNGHTVLMKHPITKEYVEKSVKDLNTVKHKVPLNGLFVQNGISLSDDMIKLYAYIAADGTIKHDTNLVRFIVKKERKIKAFQNLLTLMNIPFKQYIRSNGEVSTNFYLPKELEGWDIKGLDNKLLKMSEDQTDVFISSYIDTDGYKSGNSILIYTSKKSEAEIISHICAINNWNCNLYSRVGHGFSKGVSYELCCTKNLSERNISSNNFRIEQVNNEPFWCIKTKHQNFIMRRNGKVMITGNCHGNKIDHHTGQKMREIPNRLDVGIDAAYGLLDEHKPFTWNEVKSIIRKERLEFEKRYNIKLNEM